MIKSVTLLFILSFFAASNLQANQNDDLGITADELKTATKIYKRYCSKCHGKKGKGDGRMNRLYVKLQVNRPSNFTIGYFEGRSSEYLRRIIVEGGEKNSISKYMPPFADELSEKEIDALVKLIKVTGKMRDMPAGH